jgi:hypothetical protein
LSTDDFRTWFRLLTSIFDGICSWRSQSSSLSPPISPKGDSSGVGQEFNPDLSVAKERRSLGPQGDRDADGSIEQSGEFHLTEMIRDLAVSNRSQVAEESDQIDDTTPDGVFLTPIREGAQSREEPTCSDNTQSQTLEKQSKSGLSSPVQEALKDISVLTTGQVLKHKEAMESLVGILKQEKSSKEVVRVLHNNGATHVLHTNINASDRDLRTMAARGLVEICEEPQALDEICSSREVSSRIVGTSIREIVSASGDEEVCSSLLNTLIHSKSNHVISSCAEHKVVTKLLHCLEKSSDNERQLSIALDTLQVMVDTGGEYFMNSLVWNGALETMIQVLSSTSSEKVKIQIVDMLSRICERQSSFVEMMCTPATIQGLSSMLADPLYPMHVQILVARLLFNISQLPKKTDQSLISFQDHCLPRICELIHQSKAREDDIVTPNSGDATEEGILWVTSAGIASHLARDSDVCCQVIIFHADVLQQSVRLLTQSREYSHSRSLLKSAKEFALNC